MATDAEVMEVRDWLEMLAGQVRQMRMDQHIFHEVQEIIATNTELHKPSHFYTWLQDMYVAAIAMAIRRQLDDDARTMSFYRFLKRLKGDPSSVSRRRYRALYSDDNSFVMQLKTTGLLEQYVNDAYDELVGAGKAQPLADDIELEIVELRQVADRFVGFANQVVAHDDRTKPSDLPTFGEVDDVISYMEKLLQRYIQLLEATHAAMDLNFQYDWKAIFRVAWLPTPGNQPC